MSYEESYAQAFPFDKMVSSMLGLEMIEDTVRIVNEAIKDKVQVNLIINNRAGGNAPPDRPDDRRQASFGIAGEFVSILFLPIKSKTWIIRILNPFFLEAMIE